jgi:hypothetical protein
MFNAYWEALDFDLPLSPAAAVAGWQRWIDTSLNRPRTSWMPLPPRRCPECNTASRLAPWRRCLSELMGAAGPSWS